MDVMAVALKAAIIAQIQQQPEKSFNFPTNQTAPIDSFQATRLMVLLLSKPRDSPARTSTRPQHHPTASLHWVTPFCCSYHPPLCLEAVIDGPPFTRHCDWFHMGGCLDAILYAPPVNAAASAAASASSMSRPLCAASWLPFDHPCLRPNPAPAPSPIDTGLSPCHSSAQSPFVS